MCKNMPNYDYECMQCGHKEEILQKMTDEPFTECPQCRQSSFKRKFGRGIGLQFQGSGFYCTDYGAQPSSTEKPLASAPAPAKGCDCGKSSCTS